jgi:hypothetical protein
MTLSEFITLKSLAIAELSIKGRLRILDDCTHFVISVRLEYAHSLTILKPSLHDEIIVRKVQDHVYVDFRFIKQPI